MNRQLFPVVGPLPPRAKIPTDIKPRQDFGIKYFNENPIRYMGLYIISFVLFRVG